MSENERNVLIFIAISVVIVCGALLFFQVTSLTQFRNDCAAVEGTVHGGGSDMVCMKNGEVIFDGK